MSVRNTELAADYVRRAAARLRALDVLFEAESWADVVRESQEALELALKGLLRPSGIEPPRIHDVADVLIAERDRDVSTTQIYTHVLNRGPSGVRSPIDGLLGG